MNREQSELIRQGLPSRRQFLSALGNSAALACAAGLPRLGLGAESTSAPSKRVLLKVLENVARALLTPDPIP